MALMKLKDFDPNYRETFGGDDLSNFSLYTQGNEKVGTIDEVLVDDSGRFRYLVVDTGPWIFGKKVLLPIGLAHFDHSERRVNVDGLTKEQVESLPKYDESMVVDRQHEEQVRNVYRSRSGAASAPVDASAPLESSAPLDSSATLGTAASNRTPATGSTPDLTPGDYDRNTYDYQQDAPLYDLNERDHQTLRLYEERLIANKTRQKTGEVVAGKRVETTTQQVSVPIEKERVVIERSTPVDAGTAVPAGEAAFQGGEVARMEVYEETPDIRKEAFVREEVSLRKEVDHDTVNAEEQIRREELDVDAQGRSIEDRRSASDRPIDRPADRI